MASESIQSDNAILIRLGADDCAIIACSLSQSFTLVFMKCFTDFAVDLQVRSGSPNV